MASLSPIDSKPFDLLALVSDRHHHDVHVVVMLGDSLDERCVRALGKAGIAIENHDLHIVIAEQFQERIAIGEPIGAEELVDPALLLVGVRDAERRSRFVSTNTRVRPSCSALRAKPCGRFANRLSPISKPEPCPMTPRVRAATKPALFDMRMSSRRTR